MLITLTIIGVIAALTIPNLVASYHKHQIEAGIKEAYSILSNALKMMEADNVQFWEVLPENMESTDKSPGVLVSDYSIKYFCQYLKCNEKYPYGTIAAFKTYTGTRQMTGIDKQTNYEDVAGMSKYVLSNGMILGIKNIGSRNGLEFWVDVNGQKGPNIVGHDIHVFTQFRPFSGHCKVTGNNSDDWCNFGKRLMGGSSYYELELRSTKDSSKCSTTGLLCTTIIVNNGFHIPNNYPVKKW